MSILRVAHLVHAGSDIVALAHNGHLLDVAALEKRLTIDTSPARFTEQAGSFRQRVFSLGLAGFEELAENLGEGRPPAEAILNPKRCLFLPPTLPDRALIEFDITASAQAPRMRWGNARCLVGHDAPLRIPSDEPQPRLTVQVAAVLREDLRSASVEEAANAIAGFASLCTWDFPSRDRCSPGWGHCRLGQLGPFLVVQNAPWNPAAASVSIDVNGTRVLTAAGRPWRWSFAELVAFASDGVDLLAGDVLASGPIARVSSDGGSALRGGDQIAVEIAGLGRLSGVIVAGEERSRFPG